MTDELPKGVPRGCRRDYRMLGTPKRCFTTLAEAEAHINGGKTMNAYFCARCDAFHVGHKRGMGFGSRKRT